MRRLFLLTLLSCLPPLPALAWGADGHRIICAIAWDEMKDSTKKYVGELLSIERREQFADSCAWADEYRASHPETASWHFVNVAVGSTHVDLDRDCKEPKSCVVAQIGRDLAILGGAASKPEKIQALKFLAHFVGDVHQPLHVSYAKDRGGNTIRGKFLGHPTNMHEVWDSDLIRSYDIVWYSLADQLQTGVTDYQRQTWTASSPLDWANESLAITLSPTTQYVGQHSGFILDQGYADLNVSVVLGRLSQAGVRLGHMLDRVPDK